MCIVFTSGIVYVNILMSETDDDVFRIGHCTTVERATATSLISKSSRNAAVDPVSYVFIFSTINNRQFS